VALRPERMAHVERGGADPATERRAECDAALDELESALAKVGVCLIFLGELLCGEPARAVRDARQAIGRMRVPIV
jgi:hypothetical protein